MEDKSQSKPPFWSSLPGIFTGLGGLVVAVTGLITALYSTGVIGSKASSEAVPPVNTAVTLASSTMASPSPSVDAVSESYKALAGRWEVVEQPSKDFVGADEVTWQFDATLASNVLTLKGKILSIDGDKNLTADESEIRATYVVTLMGSTGMGEFKQTKDGVSMTYPATIRLDEEPAKFHGTIDIKGQQACSLAGRKL